MHDGCGGWNAFIKLLLPTGFFYFIVFCDDQIGFFPQILDELVLYLSSTFKIKGMWEKPQY
jgi:hypothetical protein